jgi:hypothetical protein
MGEKLRLRYSLPNAATAKLRLIDRGKTVQEVISFIAKVDRSDVNELFLDDAELPPDESFDGFYESKDQLFVFSKTETRSSKLNFFARLFGFSELSQNTFCRSITKIPSLPVRAMSASIEIQIIQLHLRHFKQDQIAAALRTWKPRVLRGNHDF